MDSVWMFFALAAALLAVALAVILPSLWRRKGTHDDAAGAGRRMRLTPWVIVIGLPVLACGLYSLGGDLGALRSERGVLSEQLLEAGLPTDAEAAERLHAELARHLQSQPRDARALVLKARLDMRAQRYTEAAAAFKLATAGKSNAAKDPGVWVEYAEATGMAQGGTLIGEPQQLVQKALALDASHAGALDLAGSAAWEMRDFATAASYWQRLLEQIPAGSTRHGELSAAIDRALQRAKLQLPSSS